MTTIRISINGVPFKSCVASKRESALREAKRVAGESAGRVQRTLSFFEPGLAEIILDVQTDGYTDYNGHNAIDNWISLIDGRFQDDKRLKTA